ncbi:hypothetical protein J518_1295 [Acinetobacter baumannii 1419130]|nr:hypothetical protein J518_1295 [Acinetobacter baumannii 1419130]
MFNNAILIINCVHGGIRHLEIFALQKHTNCIVHGGIRHLERLIVEWQC